MPFNGNTNWKYGDIVTEADMNRIEQGIKDAFAEKAPKNSPSFTGSVTLPGDPAAAMEAATKQYVDTQMAKAMKYAP